MFALEVISTSLTFTQAETVINFHYFVIALVSNCILIDGKLKELYERNFNASLNFPSFTVSWCYIFFCSFGWLKVFLALILRAKTCLIHLHIIKGLIILCVISSHLSSSLQFLRCYETHHLGPSPATSTASSLPPAQLQRDVDSVSHLVEVQ